MKNLIRLTDLSVDDIHKIFNIADNINDNKYSEILKGKTAVMFFPDSSIRTRVTFEKGIYLSGGQSILFPPETLDKREAISDVIGYLNNWADIIIVRHKNIELIEEMAQYAHVPIINALSGINHPCEMLSDMYALSKMRNNVRNDKFLFCGINGNIGNAWKEASQVFGFELEQCCARGYEIDGIVSHYDINTAVIGKDIICTDSLTSGAVEDFKDLRITRSVMQKANPGAILDPCPPFYRGEEVSEDVISSEFFVGYEFKKCLLQVQQAIIIYCMLG